MLSRRQLAFRQRQNEARRRRAGVIFGSALGVLLLLYAAELDVLIGFGKGQIEGEIAVQSSAQTMGKFGWQTGKWIIMMPAGSRRREPVIFGLYSPEALEQLERSIHSTGGAVPSDPLFTPAGVPPPPGAVSAPVHGRLYYAGLVRKSVYRFEELPGG